MRALNPTLTIQSGPDRWTISCLRDGRAPLRTALPASIGRALVRAQQGAAVDSLFDSALQTRLHEMGVLLTDAPEPAPTYQCAAPVGEVLGPLQAHFQLQSHGADPWLVERMPWGEAARWRLGSEAVTSFLDGQATPALSVATRDRRPVVERALTEARADFANRQFAILDHLVAPAELEALADYAQSWRRRGLLDGDYAEGGRQRSHRYDDPQLAWLLQRGATWMSALCGRRVRPSYSFLAMYRPGGILPLHTDPEHCPLSLSLVVEQSPGARQWPLWVKTPAGVAHELTWGPGQSLAFVGRDIAHGRPPLPAGEQATSLVLHFQWETP